MITVYRMKNLFSTRHSACVKKQNKLGLNPKIYNLEVYLIMIFLFQQATPNQCTINILNWFLTKNLHWVSFATNGRRRSFLNICRWTFRASNTSSVIYIKWHQECWCFWTNKGDTSPIYFKSDHKNFLWSIFFFKALHSPKCCTSCLFFFWGGGKHSVTHWFLYSMSCVYNLYWEHQDNPRSYTQLSIL